MSCPPPPIIQTSSSSSGGQQQQQQQQQSHQQPQQQQNQSLPPPPLGPFNRPHQQSSKSKKLPSLTIPKSPGLSPIVGPNDNLSIPVGDNNSLHPPGQNSTNTTPSSAASDIAKSGIFSAEILAAVGEDGDNNGMNKRSSAIAYDDTNTTPNNNNDDDDEMMTATTMNTTTAAINSMPAANSNDHSNISSTTADVDFLDEDGWKSVARAGDIVELGRLGEGHGGSVMRCKLRHGKTVFALKEITTNPSPELQKQILRELQFNRTCNSPHIVKYYGTFLNEETANIFIAMEYCGGGSLDSIYKRVKSRGGRIGEKVLAKIADGVLSGLSYLHERRIIHRDIKPQNILLDVTGQVKLCDFGVSGEVVNSLATTFTGTSYYMAPERIQGQPYTVTSDVWSLGLTVMEVAQHRFPFLPEDEATAQPLMPIELLTFIVNMPAPELRDEPDEGIYWSDAFRHFLSCCLEKDNKKRASPRQMLKHPWLVGHRSKIVRMDKFVNECWI